MYLFFFNTMKSPKFNVYFTLKANVNMHRLHLKSSVARCGLLPIIYIYIYIFFFLAIILNRASESQADLSCSLALALVY